MKRRNAILLLVAFAILPLFTFYMTTLGIAALTQLLMSAGLGWLAARVLAYLIFAIGILVIGYVSAGLAVFIVANWYIIETL